MDYLTIIIAVVALLLGAILSFFFAPKIRKEKKLNTNQSLKDNSIQVKNSTSEDLFILENEISKLKEELTESEAKISEYEEENKSIKTDGDIISDSDQTSDEKLKELDEEITQLKDEIEDLEDEISDLKKSNNRVKEEVSALDEKVYVIEKEKREITETYQQNLKKLEETENENKVQKESLSFVSDILNANNAVNEKFIEVAHKTWEIYSTISNDLRYSLGYLENNFISDDFLEDCWNWRNQEVKTWIKDKRVVAIVGEFSAGKTSIVNRILKQDDPNAVELPVKSTETTAIPTYISKGIDFNCQFYSPSGDLKNISVESFQKVTKSVLDDINISSLVKYFVLSYSNKNLSDISILDTPGFGSNSDEIISKTTEVVKEADALFWVVDANTGEINNSSMNVIKENLQKVPLYIIINKSDTKSQNDLNDLKTKIEETLNKNCINYQEVILFSHKYEIDELMGILNGIAPKKSPKVISRVNEEINRTLKISKASLNKLNKETIDLNYDVDDSISILEQTIQNIGHSLEDMDDVISFEYPLFSKNYYKIKESDYGRFEKGMSQIIESTNSLPDNINEFRSNSENYSMKIDETNEIKHYIDYLSKSRKTFMELVNAYNPKLLN
ncbi:dynamin family protein [Gelidibacter maritimus]|uniref:Dynamin family protein n=1 Tax=Gelidibacter maritimus TaxID=2761487 RepID=A0A7W2M3V0_9FLAO|nr:dynamin family protein [Gelidibacter maritimus]MBA6152193.1 dynamin family protein [Gelidibacter maritimus]